MAIKASFCQKENAEKLTLRSTNKFSKQKKWLKITPNMKLEVKRITFKPHTVQLDSGMTKYFCFVQYELSKEYEL